MTDQAVKSHEHGTNIQAHGYKAEQQVWFTFNHRSTVIIVYNIIVNRWFKRRHKNRKNESSWRKARMYCYLTTSLNL